MAFEERRFSIQSSGENYPDLVAEIQGLTFDRLLKPPPDLDTPEKRFVRQQQIYQRLSNGDGITWEEACLGIKSLPSFSVPEDYYEGLSIVGLPTEISSEAEKRRIIALQILNHPERIGSLKQQQGTEYVMPVIGHSTVFDRLDDDHLLLAFTEIAPVIPDNPTERLSRRELLKQGPFIATSLREPEVSVRVPLSSGSMNTGNPEQLAVIAMSGVQSWVYREGLCSEPEIQAHVFAETVRILHDVAHNDPQWCNRPDREFLLNFWLNQLGITVGTNLEDAKERITMILPLMEKGLIKNLGVRVYNPQIEDQTFETVSGLTAEYQNNGNILEIFAGQASSPNQLNQLLDNGAHAVGTGFFGGMKCVSSIRSGVAVSTLRDLARARGKVYGPIFVDGGVGEFWSLAYLLGASNLIKPSHMVGIESIGGRYPFYDGKKFMVDASGEASGTNKERIGRLLYNERPFAPEGDGGFAEINLERPDIPDQILEALIDYQIAPYVFQGRPDGTRYHSIKEMHQEDNLDLIFELSSGAQGMRGAYGPRIHSRK